MIDSQQLTSLARRRHLLLSDEQEGELLFQRERLRSVTDSSSSKQPAASLDQQLGSPDVVLMPTNSPRAAGSEVSTALECVEDDSGAPHQFQHLAQADRARYVAAARGVQADLDRRIEELIHSVRWNAANLFDQVSSFRFCWLSIR